MKRSFIKTSIWALLMSVCLCGMVNAEDSSTIRSDAERAFNQLTNNAIEAVNHMQKRRQGVVKGILDPKFQIAEVDAPYQKLVTTTTETGGRLSKVARLQTFTAPTKIGIKVWFELADGTMVNPTKKEWKPRERFYIHVQSSVPMYVALFQNYPESDPTSEQVYPSMKYASSFSAIQPGQPTKLPVVFEMDDNKRNEIMSMVVVQSDWAGFENALTKEAVASLTSENGAVHVSAAIQPRAEATMKSINDAVLLQEKVTLESVKENVSGLTETEAEKLTDVMNDAVENAKFRIIGSDVASSKQPNDVWFYMFGSGEVGRWQLTIRK